VTALHEEPATVEQLAGAMDVLRRMLALAADLVGRP